MTGANRRPGWILAGVAALPLLILSTGCSAKRTLTQTARTGIEQRLLAGSVERAAIQLEGPDFEDAEVYLEATGFTQDAAFAREAIASELQARGATIVFDPKVAKYVVKVLVRAFGTDRTDRFFGIPEMKSFLIPIPELTLFGWIRQTGVSRLHVTIADARTGHLIGMVEKLSGETVFNRVTIFPVSFEEADFNESPPP
jgi:hypothetical protein